MYTTTLSDKSGDFALLKNIYGSHENRFVFPRSFDRSEFDSVESIKNIIRDQANSDGVPELEKMFDYLFTPLKSDFKNLTVRCKLCKTQIKFYVNEGKLLLISMENKHSHHNEKWKKIEEKYIVGYLSKVDGVPESAVVQAPIQPTITPRPPEDNSSIMIEEKPETEPVTELVMAPPVTQTQNAPITFRRIGQDQVIIEDGPISAPPSKAKPLPPAPIIQMSVPNIKNKAVQPKDPPKTATKPATIEYALKNAGMVVYSHSHDRQSTSAPDIIVAMTGNMKNTLLRFGDVVSFEMTDCIVKDDVQGGASYKLSLFTVFDTNCRILIVAIALHRTQTVADLFRVFKEFFKFTEKCPGVMITSQHQAVVRTIDILKEIALYKGVHILDSESVIEDVANNFNYDEAVRKEIVRLITKVIQEGNQEHALKALDAMCHLVPDDNGDRTIMNFLENKDRVCLWSLPAVFVGVGFSSSRQVGMLVHERLHLETTITTLMTEIIAIDGILCDESNGPGKYYKECTEDLFRDQHIKMVRTNIEQNIFKLFVRSYIQSVKEDNLFGKSIHEVTQKEVTHIVSRLTGSIYDVTEGQCSCKESIKTGIPCQHMVTVARASNSEYLPMFAARWKKVPNNPTTSSSKTK